MRKRSAGRKSSESPGKGRPRGVERATLGGVGLRIAVGSSEADLKTKKEIRAPFQVRGGLVIRLGRASGPRLPCGWGGQPSGMGSARGVSRGWVGLSLYRQNRPTIVISMNLVTPAVPCLRQVVHALADPASRDRP